MTAPQLGPKDPVVAAVVETIEVMRAAGEATDVPSLIRRFRRAEVPIADDVIREASRWLPYAAPGRSAR